ncbi:hypothetical protein BCR32DRAFT_266434 [Anaeromyces robustus]|uniref:Uncharacterized protein n=1 Tax=Anaeromyces robustus TaxID=1754192 RepID=A0A1Y1XEP4_9FUNG|nr:hypothetical protein BCR32DRAFT_266434 [Anaeromyces robustus]|eukprot:ORX84219.1 hypothetical protein BCR32DRAFT_266434 [Anaeromyces robustus]
MNISKKDFNVENDLRKFSTNVNYDKCKTKHIPYRNYLNNYQLIVDSTPLYTSEINSDIIPPLNRFYDKKNISINTMKDEKNKNDNSSHLPFQSILEKVNFKENSSYFDSSENKDKEDSIFVTIDFSKMLSIVITPICIKIIQEFVEALDINRIPDETFIDLFQIKYVSRLLEKHEEILSSIGLLVHLPSLYIQCIQDVIFPEGKNFINETTMITSDNTLSFNEFLIEDLYLKFYISQKININNNSSNTELMELKTYVEFSKIRDIFRFINEYDSSSIMGVLIPDEDNKFDVNNYNQNTIDLINNPSFLYICIDKLRLELYYNPINTLTQSSVIFNLDNFNISMINQTLELISSSALRWIEFIKSLINIIDNFNNNNKKLQKLVATVIKESKRLNILSNPTFLTQPSPLWRLGTSPHKSDPGWKLLFHIRYAMKELQKRPENILKTLIPIKDTNTLYNITMKNLLDWYNWENISENCDLINLIFNKPLSTNKLDNQIKDVSNYIPTNLRICLQIGKVQLQIFDNKIEKNLINISPTQMDLIVKPKEIISNQVTNDLNRYYYNILYYGAIGRINVILNTNLLILAKHSIRAIGWLSNLYEKPKVKTNNTNTIKESIKNLSKNNPKYKNMNIFHGLFSIKTVCIKLSANTLELKFKLRNSSISTYNLMFNNNDIDQIKTIEELNLHYHENAEKVSTAVDSIKKVIIQHNSILKISSLSTNLIEKNIYSNGKPLKNELAEINLNNFNIHIGLNKLLNEHLKTNVIETSKKVSLLITLGSLNINVLKSIILLYSCFDKWSDEYLDKYKFLIDEMVNEINSDKSNLKEVSISRSSNEIKEENIFYDVDYSLLDDIGINIRVIFNKINIRMDLFSSAGLLIDFPNIFIELSKGESKNSGNTTMYLYSVNISSPKVKLNLTNNNYIENNDSNFSSELPQVNISGVVITDTSKKNLGLNISINLILNKYHCKITSSIVKAVVLLPYLIDDEFEQIKTIYNKFSINQSNEEKLNIISETKKEEKKNIFELYDIKFSLKYYLQNFQIVVKSETENIAFDIYMLYGRVRVNDFNNKELEKEYLTNKNKILFELSSKNIVLSFNSISNYNSQVINNRLAYIFIDLSINNKYIMQNNENNDIKQLFNIEIKDIHSVLHIISIEKFLKFLLSFKSEIKNIQGDYSKKKSDMKKSLYESLTVLKDNNIMEKNNENNNENNDVIKLNESSILDNLIINLTITRVATIIPLQDNNDNQQLIKNNGKVIFLYFYLLKFRTDFLKDFSNLVFYEFYFQFIESFDLNNSKLFSPIAHQVENRLKLQKCDLSLTTQKDENNEDQYLIETTSKGIMVDVNLSLATYIDILLKMYYRSSKKYNDYAPLFEDSGSSDDISIKSTNEDDNSKKENQKPFDLSILNKVKIKVDVEPSIMKLVSKIDEINSNNDFDNNKINLNVINFPRINMFFYCNKLINKSLIEESNTFIDQLFLNINIYESENIIKPLIFQFMEQFMNNFKSTNELIKMNSKTDDKKQVVIKDNNKSKSSTPNDTIAMFMNHIIYINFNINNTKIGLSCQPSSKVSSILEFNNFSFTSNYSLNSKKEHSLVASLNLNSLSLLVNNSYSPEHFFDICLSNIIVNYTLLSDKESENDYSNVGEFCIPQIITNLNIRYLQDFLILYDIWINSRFLQSLSKSIDKLNEINDNNNAIIINNKNNIILSNENNNNHLEKKKSFSMEFTDYLSISERNHSFYLLANIGNIKGIYDLNQITGKGEININMINLSFNKIYRQYIPRINCDFLIKNISVTSEGKLQGFIRIENININGDVRNPILSLSKDNNSYSVLSLNRIGRIYSDLVYQFDKTFLLDITNIYLVSSDQYQLNEKPKLFLKSDVLVKYIKLCISKKAISMIYSIEKKFSSFIKEKQLTLNSDVNKSIEIKKDKNKEKDTTENKEKTVDKIKKIAYDYIFDKSSKLFPSLYGIFSITLEKALIVAFRYDFKDPDSVKLNSNKLILDVKLNYDTQQIIKKEDIKKIIEDTKFSCEGIKVAKGSYKFVTKQNENNLELNQWFTYLDDSPSKNILNIPKTIIQLNVNKYIINKVVEYSFESSFSEPIDVALNFGLYIYLVNLIKLYLSTINNDAKENSNNDTKENNDYHTELGSKNQDQIPSSNSSIDEDKKKMREYKKQINEEIHIISKKHQDLFKNSSNNDIDYEFKAIKPIILEPQLKVIGDATSWEWVDYIGVSKEKIPVELYKYVTNNFELLFNTICQVYGIVSIPLENTKKK